MSNQHTLPRTYPRKPTGKVLTYIVYDNGGSQFPIGHYNKCGKFKPRYYKVGTSAYKSLRKYQSIAELQTDPVPDNEGEYTSEDEDDVPLSHL